MAPFISFPGESLSLTTDVLHIPVPDESLREYVLAINRTLGTVSLLCNRMGSPTMLREQQLTEEELAALLFLVQEGPGSPPERRRTGDALSDEEKPRVREEEARRLLEGPLWHKLAALECALLYQGRYALCMRRRLDPDFPEEAEEFVPISLNGLIGAGLGLVANQALCTIALLSGDSTGVRLLQEYRFSPAQLAILLAIFGVHPTLCVHKDIYPDLVQADTLYGPMRIPDAFLQHPPQIPFDSLSPLEHMQFEGEVWQELSRSLPFLQAMGITIRREVAYKVVPGAAALVSEQA